METVNTKNTGIWFLMENGDTDTISLPADYLPGRHEGADPAAADAVIASRPSFKPADGFASTETQKQ